MNAVEQQLEGMLTTNEAAEYLGCDRCYILATIRRGRLPATRLPNGEWGLIMADLMEYDRTCRLTGPGRGHKK